MINEIRPGSEAFDAFYDYWSQLEQAGPGILTGKSKDAYVPYRASFNPMKVHRLLPHVYMVEWKSEELLEVRIGGTALDETAGYVLKGTNYYDTCGPHERDFYRKAITPVVQWPCGLRFSRTVALKSGAAYRLRSLSLPLADKQGEVRYIVGMMNVIRDIPMSRYEERQAVSSKVHSFSFIDIGAGTPPLPEEPQF